MSENSSLPEVSVVICSYSEDRWDRLIGALDSVRTQTFPPKQTIVVVDYNVDLYKRLIFTVPDAVIVENAGPKGLSGARNTGAGIAKAEIVAFLDDDAEAEPDWLERLAAMYDDPDVLAVGGRVEPLWEAGRPGYFANELDWIVGCTYRGMPKVAAEVRNVIGANMSFRANVLERVGGFNTTLGRQDAVPLGCEETELCIRAVIGAPGSRVVYEPAALVHHHVPAERGTAALHAGPVLGRRDFQGAGQQGGRPQTGTWSRTALRPAGPASCSVRRNPRLARRRGPCRARPGRGHHRRARGHRDRLCARPPAACGAVAGQSGCCDAGRAVAGSQMNRAAPFPVDRPVQTLHPEPPDRRNPTPESLDHEPT